MRVWCLPLRTLKVKSCYVWWAVLNSDFCGKKQPGVSLYPAGMLVHHRVISSTFTPVLIYTPGWNEKFLVLSLFIIFVARNPNLPVGYWRWQSSPVHSAVYITVHRKTGDENVNVLRNTTVLSAVHLNVHSSVFFFLYSVGIWRKISMIYLRYSVV